MSVLLSVVSGNARKSWIIDYLQLSLLFVVAF